MPYSYTIEPSNQPPDDGEIHHEGGALHRRRRSRLEQEGSPLRLMRLFHRRLLARLVSKYALSQGWFVATSPPEVAAVLSILYQ
jgi:hypothetical protein